MESKDAVIEVRLSHDKLDAYIRITPEVEEGKPATKELAMHALRKNGVIYGINENTITRLFSERKFGVEVPVAHGDPPKNGKDAELKFLFSTAKSVKPVEDEKGNVDYKNVQLVKNCQQGDKLVQIIPETKGSPGKGVDGKPINAKDGAPIRLPSGSNTQPSPEDPFMLVATVDGNIKYQSGGLVEVDPVFVVHGDVDYSVGNLDCVGSLIIKGDVKAGFSVKAKGEVEVWGVVEDAEVESAGDIMLKQGIAGRGNGKISAAGNIYVKFCENQTLVAQKDIIVGEELMHSKIESNGKIILKGKKGLIVGGSVTAINGIEAKTIGNYQHVKTDIVVGINQDLMEKLQMIETDIEKNTENLENVKKAIYTLVKVRIAQGGLNPEKQALLTRLQKLKDILPQQMEKLENDKVAVETEIEKYKGVTVTVKNKVYPGVKIIIQKFKKTINEELENVVFAVEGNEISY